ncbi:hypothetical protein [Brevundimonas kwangchunensis]
MCIDIAHEALRSGRVLDLHFEALSQCVEVHAIGWDLHGQPTVLGWVVADSSIPKQRDGWKLIRLDRALSASVSGARSIAPRPGYASGAEALAEVLFKL